MAQLYPDGPSISPGDLLWLHVASNTSRFRVDFYRHGATFQAMGSASFQGGSAAQLSAHDSDFAWPAFAFPVPASWPSGVYVALCVEDGGSADIADPANRHAITIFVVKSATPGTRACILYKVPTFTYTAYNELGDPPGSLYTGGGHKVTMRRPGCGAGADPWDAIYADVYDTGSPRQTFLHWDGKFVQWLEQHGYDVEYCSDLDVHLNPDQLLSSYRLVLSVGHDEYWSKEMRDNLEGYVSAGGNVAFFSGNVCWWRVHLADNNTALVCDKTTHDGVPGSYDQWWTGQNKRPENSLTGVSYRNAGGHWSGPRPVPLGYTVQYATHWVYANVSGGTGGPLQDGDVIGGGANDALVGYESDGAALAPAATNSPRVTTSSDGTPESFLVLGFAPVSSFQDAEAGIASVATMGLYTRGGIVFTAATTDWARVLASGNAQITQITRNVLDGLQSRALRIVGFGGACSRQPAVEGATIVLRVDTTKLASAGNLTYAWTSSAGTPRATTTPTFTLTLPSPPEPVTVSVTISDGTDCPAFGTLTFTPMALSQYEQVKMICHLRDLVMMAARYRKPLEGSRERSQLFVDPLWDPIRGTLLPVLERGQLERIATTAQKIESLAQQLIGEHGAR